MKAKLSGFLGGLWLIAALLVPAMALANLPDFTELYEKHGPAVVNISVTHKAKVGGQMPHLSEDDPFYEFFKRFGFPRGPQREFQQQAAGSGFIISADGYVVTNSHVVDGAEEVDVKLTDKREFKAKVVGVDKRTDVALIKIEANNLPRVTIGDPNKLRVGEWVVAIGQPFGLENTITAGIVSAKGRDRVQDALVPFIQTDAAINPGNSGGPLMNLKGEVVGVNTLIYSRTGGYMGLAFAIPIDVAMDVVNQLRSTGKVTRGRIGVTIQEVDKEKAEAFGLAKAAGALVNAVTKGGPAEKAGVEPGDIILKFDGKSVTSNSDLPRIVAGVKPGAKTTVTVWRKGSTKDLAITVEEWKDDTAGKRNPRGEKGVKEKSKSNRLGLVVSDLTEEQRRDLGVKQGVLVEDVLVAGRGGLQPGDVILTVIHKGASTDIKSVDQLNALLGKAEKGASVTLLLKRDDNQLFASVKLSD
ncbi:serine protease Do [Burkholderiales bacterium]|nr:MAG: DegQ family serine endoprotease [Burkholderiales bacterium]CAG1010565.1 serine protease Do [Burkholderiales bacterium]